MINIAGLLARSSPMPMPFAPRIILSQNARTDLQALARAHSTPQSLSLRARIVLKAADIDTPTNLQIGRDLGCTNRTVGKWRRRFVALGLSGLQDAARAGRPRTIVSSTRVQVISVASALPTEQDRPVTRWTLAEIVATVLDALHTHTLSRSSVWRILHDIDLKPHKSAYWLNSHDAHFDAKAHTICQLYLKALEAYQQGRLVICCDEKTGMQVLERKAPTKPAQPGRRERREHAYIRRGTRVLINSLAVATGHIAWTLGATRKTADFGAHLQHVYQSLPPMPRYDWIMDNLNTHWSLDVCRLVAQWCQVPCDPKKLKTGAQRRVFLCDPSHSHVFHFTPKHGSWLNQAELFFGVLHRRFLARGSFRSVAEFEARLERFLQDYNTRHAHPYRWTYTGEPLVRDTPFSRTRRQQRRGRACFSPRPKRFERLFYAPRPYHRRAA
ncbi:MAG: IS630 family transposase [Nitrososphaeraceae archaeon]